MASNKLTAIFEAREEISAALQKAQQATSSYDRAVEELEQEFVKAREAGNLLNDSYDRLTAGSAEIKAATDRVEQSIESADTALRMYAAGGISASEANDAIRNSVIQAAQASRDADEAFDDLQNELNQINAAGQITTKEFKNLRRQLMATGGVTSYTDEAIDSLLNSMVQTNIGTRSAANAVDKFNNELSDLTARTIPASVALYGYQSAADEAADETREVATNAAIATGALGALASVAEASSFQFSSLSINIGPFNLALSNIIVQLPAIITGLGSVLAMVSALATAFVTAAGAMGAFIGAGAVAWAEENESQFEDTGQAIEAMTGALRDLFQEAIQPLVNDANMQLFFDFVTGLARAVNRVSQLFNQMRGDIISFFDGMEGSVSESFEAIHDSFDMLTPVMQDVINFFLTRFPDALMLFSRVTVDLANSLGPLIDSLRRLFNQLLILGTTIADGIMPVFSAILDILTGAITVFNALGDGVGAAIAQMLALSFVAWRVYSVISTLSAGTIALQQELAKAAIGGSGLSKVLLTLLANTKALIFGNLSLSAAISNVRLALINTTSATTYNTASKLANAAAAYTAAAANTLFAAANYATAGALGVATAAAIGLNAALGGLPMLIGAIAVAGGLLVGAIANVGAVSAGVGGVLSTLMDVVVSLGNSLLKIFVPTWNLLVNLFEIIFAPIIGIVNGIMAIAGAFSSAGGEGGGFLSMLLGVFDVIMSLGGAIIGFINPALNVLGQIIQKAVVIPFQIVAGIIGALISTVMNLVTTFMQLSIVQSVIQQIAGFFEMLGNVIDTIIGTAIDLINGFIETANLIPGVNIETINTGSTRGARTSVDEVQSQMASDQEDQEDDIATEPNVDLNFEENLEQNVDVQADPEDQEGLRRIVKDAMNEANSIQRRRQGHTN